MDYVNAFEESENVIEVHEDVGQVGQVKQENRVYCPRKYLTLERKQALSYFDDKTFAKEVGLTKESLLNLTENLQPFIEPKRMTPHQLPASLRVLNWAVYSRSHVIFHVRTHKSTVSRIVRQVRNTLYSIF